MKSCGLSYFIEVTKNITSRSERVIQCQGELHQLGDDEVVHSIGSGHTHK